MVEQMQGKAVNELRSIVDEAELKGEYLEDLNEYLQEFVFIDKTKNITLFFKTNLY